MKRVMVIGARGKTGTCIVRGVEAAQDLELAGAVDLGDDLQDALAREKPEVAVDFTAPDAVMGNVELALRQGVHAVIGTSGLQTDQLAGLDALARENNVGCLFGPNFALGAVLMMRFAEEAARHFPHAEIIERHHATKLDAPSGTARATAQKIAAARTETPPAAKEKETAPGARGGRIDEIAVHAVRLPGSIAHQEVLFGGPGETLVIRHDTADREVFVPGVLLAVRKIGEHTGLVHGLEPLLWPAA
ncbi:MAG: 4-hydroxy-tetrahydrodipicolinate reductase [Planctomycetota bacterium]|jgi:4-hydroxy-tetrahydrodipicolinate reductase